MSSPASAINSWVQLGLTVVPELPALIAAWINLFKKHPELSPDQVLAILKDQGATSNAAMDAAIAKIDAALAGPVPVAPNPPAAPGSVVPPKT